MYKSQVKESRLVQMHVLMYVYLYTCIQMHMNVCICLYLFRACGTRTGVL